MNHGDLLELGGAIVTIASVLANVVPPHTVVGKILHFVALNFFAVKKAEPKQ